MACASEGGGTRRGGAAGSEEGAWPGTRGKVVPGGRRPPPWGPPLGRAKLFPASSDLPLSRVLRLLQASPSRGARAPAPPSPPVSVSPFSPCPCPDILSMRPGPPSRSQSPVSLVHSAFASPCPCPPGVHVPSRYAEPPGTPVSASLRAPGRQAEPRLEAVPLFCPRQAAVTSTRGSR